jgi:hypothetical protein
MGWLGYYLNARRVKGIGKIGEELTCWQQDGYKLTARVK